MTVKSKGGQPNDSCRVLTYIQHNYLRTLNDVGPYMYVMPNGYITNNGKSACQCNLYKVSTHLKSCQMY